MLLDNIFDDLADAWHELQEAHIDVEGSDPQAPGFREKLEELRLALAKYAWLVERLERQVEREEHP